MSVTISNINADWSTRHKRINTQDSLGKALALAICDPAVFAAQFGLVPPPPTEAGSANIAVITEARKTMRVRLTKELRAMGGTWASTSAAVGYQGEETLILLWDATQFAQDLSYVPRSDPSAKTLAVKLDWIGPPADDDGETEQCKSMIAVASHMPRVPYARLGNRSAAQVFEAHRNLAVLLEHAKEQEVDTVDGAGDYNLGKKDSHHLPRLADSLGLPVSAFAFQDNSCDNIWSTYERVGWHSHSLGPGLFSHPPQRAVARL